MGLQCGRESHMEVYERNERRNTARENVQRGNVPRRDIPRGNAPRRAASNAGTYRRKEKRRILPVLLLAVNLLLLLLIWLQVKKMNNALDDALGRMAAAQRDAGSMTEYLQKGENITDEGASRSVDEVDYAEKCALYKVDPPVERTPEEVLERLKQLARENGTIEKIWSNSAAYPEKMLEALANNPEMADFVEQYPGKKGIVTGGLTEAEKKQEYPLFLQWDPRWGYGEYGDQSNIGLAGCGPTCLSMVLYYMTRDEALTPNTIAEYSMENGYYLSGTGTMWKLLEDVPALYGIDVEQPKAEERTMKQELDRGNLIICSMGKGDFTVTGHFVVIYGYDKDGFLVNDPNCVARSRKSWTFKELEKQIKHMWTFSAV